MNACIDIRKTCTTFLLMVSGMLIFSPATNALPEDANQEITIVGGSGGVSPDQGLYIIREDAEGLAHIKQGSMEIFASEIRTEIIDGVLNKATAVGTPARFQQQPTIDQAIIYLSGHTLDYDNSKRMLNIDGEAHYEQAGQTLDGRHIDYNLDTGDANAEANEGERVKIVIPPPPAAQP
jgi:lipopolysaccharide export system protein LptA